MIDALCGRFTVRWYLNLSTPCCLMNGESNEILQSDVTSQVSIFFSPSERFRVIVLVSNQRILRFEGLQTELEADRGCSRTWWLECVQFVDRKCRYETVVVCWASGKTTKGEKNLSEAFHVPGFWSLQLFRNWQALCSFLLWSWEGNSVSDGIGWLFLEYIRPFYRAIWQRIIYSFTFY